MNRLWWMILVVAVSCGQTPDFECRRTDECRIGVCVAGECLTSVSDRTQQPIGGRDASAEEVGADAGGPLFPRGPCADRVPPTPDRIVLNELLANVPSGPSGDANGDGIRDAFDDEFVEIVNVSPDAVDMTGVRIVVGGSLKFVFEPLCLHAGASVSVFGGGQVGAVVSGSAVVSEVAFVFSNSGGQVALVGPSGQLDTLQYPELGPGSYARAPDFVGPWRHHPSISAMPFSPGRCVDGREITTGCPAEVTPAADMDAGSTDAEGP